MALEDSVLNRRGFLGKAIGLASLALVSQAYGKEKPAEDKLGRIPDYSGLPDPDYSEFVAVLGDRYEKEKDAKLRKYWDSQKSIEKHMLIELFTNPDQYQRNYLERIQRDVIKNLKRYSGKRKEEIKKSALWKIDVDNPSLPDKILYFSLKEDGKVNYEDLSPAEKKLMDDIGKVYGEVISGLGKIITGS